MKRFLIKTTSYGLITFVIFNCIAFLSLFALRQSCFYKPQFVMNGVPEKEFDYLVLGSSTGLTTLDTKLIDSLTGKKGLNISMDDSGLPSHYLMLQHFYAQNKKTSSLILAITPWEMSLLNPVLNENDYRFLPHVNSTYVYDYYNKLEKTNLKKLSISKYFPVIGVGYYNIELFYPSLLTFLSPKKRNRFDDKGNFSYPLLGAPKEERYQTTNLDFKNPYFFKIKEFCLANNIQLLLYQSPLYKTKVVLNSREIIINHSDLLKDPTLFYDNIHVNKKGRVICSEQIANYL